MGETKTIELPGKLVALEIVMANKDLPMWIPLLIMMCCMMYMMTPFLIKAVLAIWFEHLAFTSKKHIAAYVMLMLASTATFMMNMMLYIALIQFFYQKMRQKQVQQR